MKKVVIIITSIALMIMLIGCQKPTESTNEPTPVDEWKVVYDIKPTSPYFMDSVSACYQVFPYSFADSNGDGIGDLNGIMENLDYFSEILGVDCLWLNPINPSPSYHKYDVTDYYAIDRQFGTMQDFENLLSEAKSRNIRILMDLVINHTSSRHPWFINSTIGPAATYREFYVWNTLEDRVAFPDRLGWYLRNGVYYFASFWEEMPELNFENPLVRAEIKNILTFWLNKGVDGFRIDAAKHIYDIKEYPAGTRTLQENINYFKEFNHYVKEINPDAFVVGEVYTSGSSYVSNFFQGMDSAFNFELADSIINGLQSNSSSNIAQVLLRSQSDIWAKKNNPLDSIFLTNHDQNRLADQVGFNLNKMKLASQVLMTIPGISWIYYGEELGMGGSKPDNNIRQAFKWGTGYESYIINSPTHIPVWGTYNQSLLGTTEQLQDPDSLLNNYIKMIEIRKQNRILSRGTIESFQSPQGSLLTYALSYEGFRVVVIHNFSINAIDIEHNLSGLALFFGTHETQITSSTFRVEPYSTTILRIDQGINAFR